MEAEEAKEAGSSRGTELETARGTRDARLGIEYKEYMDS